MMNDSLFIWAAGRFETSRRWGAAVRLPPQSVHPVRVCSAPCEGLREVGPWGLSSSRVLPPTFRGQCSVVGKQAA